MGALFSLAMVLPGLRALRRRRAWQWLRLGTVVVATAGAVTWAGWWRVLAVAIAVGALALRRTGDPDRERRLQRLHGAQYFLNGGEWRASGCRSAAPGIPSGTALHLLLRGRDLMLLTRNADAKQVGGFGVDAIRRILVDGRDYVPIYISEAKQPPVRDKHPDRHAVSKLSLQLEGDRSADFLYQGTFARHLAESAAHALFSVRSQRPG